MKLSRLPILILYPHSRCNCRCVMCDIWRRTEASEIMAEDIARWREDIQALGVEEIVLSGGEALMHSDLRALTEPLRACGAKLTLLTTGLRLADQAALVDDQIDEVIVSLDGPREIHDAIRRIPGGYDRLAVGLRSIRTSAHARCTIQKANHRALGDTVAAARQLGLGSISFLAVDTQAAAFDHTASVQDAVGLSASETGRLAADVEELIEQEAGQGYVREPPEKLRAIVARFRARLGQQPPQAPPCTAPWVSAVIETDGALRPCFFHEAVGNVREQGLLGALNSDQAIGFREELDVSSNPTCRNCVCSLNRPRGR